MTKPTAIATTAAIRTDIQALRGFAVLVVVFYHAKVGVFSAGYLGVDVFFVISGFLISRLIKDGIEQGTFHFSDFYFRRAKRLLPAAYVTFLVTALLSPLFLSTSEIRDFWEQMVGAVTFTANFALWRQSGYFGGAAELKPLLHVWSLAIEEQYYFFLPAIMVFVPRRFWMGGAVLVLVASLALCLARAGRESTFYLLPTRAWELALGSFGTLLLRGQSLNRLIRFAFWPALVAMVGLSMFQLGQYHPGWDALLICLATLVVILRAHPLLMQGPAIRGISWVGDISYSLYLVHWPLFAFLHNVWLGEAGRQSPMWLRIGLVALSFVLAYLLNRYVEVPVRRIEIKRRKVAVKRAIAGSLGLVLITSGIAYATIGPRDFAQTGRSNLGFGAACDFDSSFEPIPECRNSATPQILVWGDSFAMHLVPGILGNQGGAPPIIQATNSLCGPLLGVAMFGHKGRTRQWAKDCINFNESVIAYLKKADSIETVVLSSRFNQYTERGEQLLKRGDRYGTYQFVNTGLDEPIEGVKKTVDAVRALGKRVVVVAPPPISRLDVARCVERVERHLPVMGVDDECMIAVDAYHKVRGDVLELLAALASGASVEVISFDPFLCDVKQCKTVIDGTLLYYEEGHLSHKGSVLVANGVSLVEKIDQLAK